MTALLALLFLGLGPQSHNLQGRVIDRDTGAPIGGASVRLIEEGTAASTVSNTTDEQGAYSIPYFPDRQYWLDIAASHYQSRALIGLEEIAAVGPEIKMTRFAVLEGRVFGGDGGTVIALRILENDVPTLLQASIDRASGEFRFRDLPPGKYEIGVLNPGGRYGLTVTHSAARGSDISVVSGETPDRLSIFVVEEPRYRLRGRAINPEGAPVVVTLVPKTYPLVPTFMRGAAANGAFDIPAISAGDYEVLAFSVGARPYWGKQTVTIINQDIDNFVVNLEPSVDIKLATSYLDPKCAGGELTMTALDGWTRNYAPRTVVVPRTGSLSQITPGRYALTFKKRGAAAVQCKVLGSHIIEITKEDRTVPDVAIGLGPQSLVRVAVIPPIRGLIAAAMRTQDGAVVVATALTDVDGYAELGPLSPGRYCLRGSWPPNSTVHQNSNMGVCVAEIEVSNGVIGDLEVTLSRAAATVTGESDHDAK